MKTTTDYTALAREYLIARCADHADDPFAAVVTLEDLATAIDPGRHHFKPTRWRGLAAVLEDLADDDRAHGRPWLAALVRDKRKLEPPSGFWKNLEHIPESGRPGYWQGQVTAVVQLWAARQAMAGAALRPERNARLGYTRYSLPPGKFWPLGVDIDVHDTGEVRLAAQGASALVNQLRNYQYGREAGGLGSCLVTVGFIPRPGAGEDELDA